LRHVGHVRVCTLQTCVLSACVRACVRAIGLTFEILVWAAVIVAQELPEHNT